MQITDRMETKIDNELLRINKKNVSNWVHKWGQMQTEFGAEETRKDEV